MMVERHNKFAPRILVVLALVVAALLAAYQVSTAQDPEVTEATYGNCRYGVALGNNAHVSWLDDLGAGWYLNFHVAAPAAPNDAEFVPVISIRQDRDGQGGYLPTYTADPPLTEAGLGARIAQRPGALWIVGNEVDRVGIQGDTYPGVYARAYHDAYHFIKARDPNAQVANSALVQISPGRLQYMDKVWDAYLNQFGKPMPVDVWNMHLYILPEKRADGTGTGAHVALGTDPAIAILDSGGNPALCPRADVHCYAEHDDMTIFAQQVRGMRQWMADHGQRHKPLIISEFSQLYVFLDYDDPVNPTRCYLQDEFGNCFTQQRVTNFLNASFNYLNTATDPNLGYPLDGNRLVQQWLWYATYVPVNETGGSSNLLNQAQNGLTQVGQGFRNYVLSEPLYVNLKPASVNSSIGYANGVTADVELTVEIANNGNRNPGAGFTVTFYSNAALTQPIGSTTVAAPQDGGGVMACARDTTTASVTWNDVSPGLHRFWVKIDSNNVISESNENDNVRSGIVLVDPHQLFVPTLQLD